MGCVSAPFVLQRFHSCHLAGLSSCPMSRNNEVHEQLEGYKVERSFIEQQNNSQETQSGWLLSTRRLSEHLCSPQWRGDPKWFWVQSVSICAALSKEKTRSGLLLSADKLFQSLCNSQQRRDPKWVARICRQVVLYSSEYRGHPDPQWVAPLCRQVVPSSA